MCDKPRCKERRRLICDGMKKKRHTVLSWMASAADIRHFKKQKKRKEKKRWLHVQVWNFLECENHINITFSSDYCNYYMVCIYTTKEDPNPLTAPSFLLRLGIKFCIWRPHLRQPRASHSWLLVAAASKIRWDVFDKDYTAPNHPILINSAHPQTMTASQVIEAIVWRRWSRGSTLLGDVIITCV